MPSGNAHVYEFGPFCLDAGARLLLRDGEPVALTPKAVETLLALVERGGRVVGRDELLREVWPDTYVEENNLSVNVSALRKALGTTPEGRPYIETLPRRGYRFVAEIRRVASGGNGFVIEKGTRERLVIIEEESGAATSPRAGSGPAVVGEAGGLRVRQRRKWSRATLLALAALLAVAVGLLLYTRQTANPPRPAPASAIRSLAVLPLKPLKPGEAGENYLGVGLADALITRLGSVGGVSVRPTSAVLRFDDPRQDSLAAARALGVDAVLEGSYQREGGRVRVTVQLVGAKDGAQLWAGTFDDEFTNVFSVQDAISTEVAEAVVHNLGVAERRRLTRRPTASVEAYQAYLQGRYFWNKRTTEGLRKAVEHFNSAVGLDPAFAQGYAGLADTYALLCNYGERPAACFAKAKESALRAIEIDPALAEPHTSLAFVLYRFERDWAGAEKEFVRAIELDPNYATAHAWYGECLGLAGRHAESIAELEAARRLDPLSLIINTDLGAAFYKARQYDAAVEQLRKTVEMERNFSVAHLFLGMAYKQKGMSEEAIAELQEAVRLSGGRTIMVAVLGNIYGTAGRRPEALGSLRGLMALSEKEYVPAFHIALIHVGLGNADEAFGWLEKASQQHDTLFAYLKVDPNLDPLRSDPRFADLLHRAGFAP